MTQDPMTLGSSLPEPHPRLNSALQCIFSSSKPSNRDQNKWRLALVTSSQCQISTKWTSDSVLEHDQNMLHKVVKLSDGKVHSSWCIHIKIEFPKCYQSQINMVMLQNPNRSHMNMPTYHMSKFLLIIYISVSL